MKRKTIEDYVELIYNIQKKQGKVHTNDIAKELDIKPSSVTEVLQKLGEEGYINYKKYSGVTLTTEGKRLAIKTKDKHEILKDFLNSLGVKENIAEEDACEMEHILHPQTMNVII
ncbi:MAG: metal-dependent transcriptional regulator, partial [Candidatus Thermoplasmatota archaeon]